MKSIVPLKLPVAGLGLMLLVALLAPGCGKHSEAEKATGAEKTAVDSRTTGKRPSKTESEEKKEAETAASRQESEWDLVDPRHEFPHQAPDVPAIKLSRNKKPHPSFLEKHRRFVERAKSGNVNLVFFGDSITEKWQEYPTLWESYFAKFKPANFGIGGDRTQHVLWRIENGEMDGIQPKVAVVMIGTNNLNTDAPEAIVSGISRVAALIHEKSPETKVLILGIPPMGEKPNPDRELIQQVNALAAKLDNGRDVVFQDIGEKFLNPDGSLPATLMPDFQHPSEEGCRVIAEAIMPRLSEWLN